MLWARNEYDANTAPTWVEFIDQSQAKRPTGQRVSRPLPKKSSTSIAQTNRDGQDPIPSTQPESDSKINGESILENFEVTTLPRLIREIRVGYPETARNSGISGDVRAELVVGSNGKVLRVNIIESPSEILSKTAVEALSSFEFSPARLNGAPVTVRILYRYRFMLEN